MIGRRYRVWLALLLAGCGGSSGATATTGRHITVIGTFEAVFNTPNGGTRTITNGSFEVPVTP